MMEICDMKNNMKLSTLKKIVVQCLPFWKDEIEIDSNIFEDIYMEAATRAIEKRKYEEGFKVTIVIECFEKKNVKNPDLHYCYNMYFVLVNAGLHNKAEMLRLNFRNLHKIDLQKESIKGIDGGSKNSNNSNTN